MQGNRCSLGGGLHLSPSPASQVPSHARRSSRPSSERSASTPLTPHRARERTAAGAMARA
jgi:hypothetical protein